MRRECEKVCGNYLDTVMTWVLSCCKIWARTVDRGEECSKPGLTCWLSTYML